MLHASEDSSAWTEVSEEKNLHTIFMIDALANAAKLLAAPLDRVKLADRPLPYEKLDQLTMEIIMGLR